MSNWSKFYLISVADRVACFRCKTAGNIIKHFSSCMISKVEYSKCTCWHHSWYRVLLSCDSPAVSHQLRKNSHIKLIGGLTYKTMMRDCKFN